MKSSKRIWLPIFLSFIICISASSCADRPFIPSATTKEISSVTEVSTSKTKPPYEKFAGPYAEILNSYAIVREKVNSSVTTHFRFVEKDKASIVVWPADNYSTSDFWGWYTATCIRDTFQPERWTSPAW